MQRKTLKRWEAVGFRFLTFSCYQRIELLGRPEWRDAFVESMTNARLQCGFKLIAWVVMPEHVHLVVVPGSVAIPEVLRSIKQPVAHRALSRWRELDAPALTRVRVREDQYRFWQAGGGFDRVVRTPEELEKTIRYIHRNPVERGLVETETDWAWSSARWFAGMGGVPCDQVPWT